MPAACFPRSQVAGDSQVTYSVTALSPPIVYNSSRGERQEKTRCPARLCEEAAMNDKTGGRQGLRRAGILAVVAAVAVLATGCGVVHVHFGGSGSAEPTTYRTEL